MTKKRCGFTLAETLIAGIILATAFTVATQMLIAASAQRKALDLRQFALLETENLMERLAVEPWSRLDEKTLSSLKLSSQATEALPKAKLAIQIEPISDKSDKEEKGGKAVDSKEPAAKRVTVVVTYGDAKGQNVQEVRLVAWRYEYTRNSIKSQNDE
jgi:Tfp pilus assembly protein PilV